MFVGPQERLCPDYSSQLEPFMKILRTNIVHSLLQEGPGFPYLSLYVYWYLVTGCDETALSFITPIDLTSSVAEIVHSVSIDISMQYPSYYVRVHYWGGRWGVGGGFLATLCTCE